MLTYEQAIEWIHSREKFKIKPGLKRMEWMMEKLDHPERELNAIHIAGTNGKGSTLSFLRNLLEAQGKNVGTFTSPYIIHFNERISVNGKPIQDDDWLQLVKTIKPLAEELAQTPLGEPTEFEVITAMALLYFKQASLDFVIMETGLGGRFDSTNIIQPIVAAITNIGLDHMKILGNSYEKIAVEKAGIIKENVPVVTAVESEEAIQVIKQKCQETSSNLFRLNHDFFVSHQSSDEEGEHFFFSNRSYQSKLLTSRMKGRHQEANAAVALEIMEVLRDKSYPFRREDYYNSIMSTEWPGRFERVSERPLVIIDGAHNEEGTKTLMRTVGEHFPDKRKFLLYAALEDKPVKGMLEQLKDNFDQITFTSFNFPRAMEARLLKEVYDEDNTRAEQVWEEALENIMGKMTYGDVLLVAGSLYFISDVRKYFEYR
ncbi:dihydrofolate synthase / folylpolyglutamate synthase [Thalassobacillus cyri]|uniref:Dihydrofolate synthase/folylpolyglutamate synthase n=1 Tax=Thalassobacillus cyri TaxID=571932 RepID=A0A1H4BW43_9BACI|nr:folylpolyglutamate synthase/dihydrofolate synthase family protein [Thalassobacillus cyri]SEA52415.1 dihydrofolate synthase / folylpolyglutamate synthase [Thalassobacillus cyri]